MTHPAARDRIDHPKRTRQRWLAALGGLSLLALSGCESALVGAECRDGFTQCGSDCAKLEEDFRHCGECGNNCGRYLCEHGMCTMKVRPDAGGSGGTGGTGGTGGLDAGPEAGPAGTGGGGGGDGGAGSGGMDGGFDPDTGLGGCLIGEQECDGSCVDPAKSHQHCGLCGHACAEAEVCSAGECQPRCEAPLVACGGVCVDPSADPQHCGACDGRCASGICESSTCADAIAGHVVVIGHDFTAANTAMRRIAGNAVFLARGAPVRVLVYRGEASAESVAGVEQAVDFSKSEIGRDWRKIEAIESVVPLQLADSDVFLLHAQANATKSTLTKLGQQWGSALAQFLVRGGIIVLFETPSPRNDGTFRVLEPARIFAAEARVTLSEQQLRVQTPGLGVALRVPDRYASAANSVHFQGVTTPGMDIVVDQGGAPVVIQRVIVPE